MRGRVLDIGGLRDRTRGEFRPPLGSVESWEYLNIDERTRPDYCCSAEEVPVGDASFDTVLMNEVMEHLEDPAKVLDEVARVMRPGGVLLLSTPFLFPVHCYPHDYQRWTATKLDRELGNRGFGEVEITAMGGAAAVIHDILAGVAKRLGSRPLRALLRFALWCSAPLWGICDRAVHEARKNVTSGYFVVAKKRVEDGGETFR
jgi:SAM-dependent methyltransferase